MDGPSPTDRARARLAIALAALATAATPGCANHIGTTATSFLNKVRDSPDPNIRFVAYAKLASPNCYDDEKQKIQAVRTLVAILDKKREPIASRAMICRTLGNLRDPEARLALRRAIEVDPDDTTGIIRSEACRALGKVGRTEDATVLVRIMSTDQIGDCRIAAIDGLGDLKAKDPRIDAALVDAMGPDSDAALRLASYQALRKITGKDLGVDQGPWRKLVRKETEALAAAEAKPKPKPKPMTAEARPEAQVGARAPADGPARR